MALSKSTDLILNLASAYYERLYTSPVKTKAITSCIIAAFGNFISQKISGAKYINENNIQAFALFGLLFGGPVPHYFYHYVQPLVRNPLKLLLVERCLYTPCFQALALYLLAVFKGSTHDEAYRELRRLYWPVLSTNLKYLTLLQYINMKFVPPMLRVLVVNFIAFFWSIYLAQQQSKSAKVKGIKK